jgi:cytochrome c553
MTMDASVEHRRAEIARLVLEIAELNYEIAHVALSAYGSVPGDEQGQQHAPAESCARCHGRIGDLIAQRDAREARMLRLVEAGTSR